MVFFNSHVWMWELDHKEGWTLKNWCFQIVVPEETLQSPQDSKDIKPVNHKGNQPWIFIGRTEAEAETPALWPPDAKSWLNGKDSDVGKDWRQKEKGAAEDEMAKKYHQLNGHEFEQTQMVEPKKPGVLQSMRFQSQTGQDLATQKHKQQMILQE